MTVSELIEKLRECDKPDADVRIVSHETAARPFVDEVYYDEDDGPVFISTGRETK